MRTNDLEIRIPNTGRGVDLNESRTRRIAGICERAHANGTKCQICGERPATRLFDGVDDQVELRCDHCAGQRGARDTAYYERYMRLKGIL
jgi:hypothetical protein